MTRDIDGWEVETHFFAGVAFDGLARTLMDCAEAGAVLWMVGTDATHAAIGGAGDEPVPVLVFARHLRTRA
ncbi:hypothetical protein GCM10008957_46730 [Deinococcus ruber]|uniref:Uncharacterized protein n=1 Tax=Deinococcus ruber TaxID=1848197 RepID=A0A918CMK9_9DEIO|nr:hypothetical protein GCM10008957_46730 [Deinococcus ruber]